MIKKTLLPFFLVFVQFVCFAQSTGDYQSVASGNWTTLSSWQYYNGSTWVSATNYPGQIGGTYAVLIQAGHTITMGTADLTTNPMGALTISGTLILDGGSGGGVFAINTQSLVVTAGLTPYAKIDFANKVTLALPANVSIQVGIGGLPTPGSGICNNNIEISIGGNVLAYCTGTGNPPANYNFQDVINNGGYNIVNASILPTSVCGSGSFTLTATAIPSSGATIKWYTTASGGTSIYTGSTYIPTISTTTTYYVEATIGTYTTPRKAVTATVNPLPNITTQPINQLDCEERSVSFKVVATGTGLTYTWQRKLPGGSFITIPAGQASVKYSPDRATVTIENVGSTQDPNGTQYQVVVSNGTCSVTSSVATLSVNEITNITSPSLTPSQSVMDITLCNGANYSYTVLTSYPSNVVSYQWKSSVTSGVWNNVVDGAHFSGATSATLNITNGTPAESAEYRVYITFDSSGADCNVSSDSRTRKLTFLPLLLTPEATVTQPNCTVATGSFTITNYNASYIYTVSPNIGVSQSGATITAPTGNYTITATLGTCISLPSANVVVNPVVTNKWNVVGGVGNWTNGTPTINQSIEFNGDYNENVDVVGCSCQVNSGDVIINSGKTMTITNTVTVSGGSLTFENNASLVQINDASENTGDIIYERTTKPIKKFDYTYWSSPVAGYTLGEVSSNTLGDKYFSFDPDTDDWAQESSATKMTVGQGYIIRAPQDYDPVAAAPYSAVFVGVPNNGGYSLTGVNPDKSYLLGNPYPSALDADKFLTDNANVLDGTIYFWTHNTAITDNEYTSDDYASYNLVGGVGIDNVPFAAGGVVATSGGEKPSGKIASGQGFFVSSKIAPISGSTVVFNNSMRVGVGVITGDNSQFFKIGNTKVKSVNTIEKHRIWLNLSNDRGAFKQTLIGYVTGATNGHDGPFDGESFDGNEYVDFYSVNQDKNLVIQGRSLPFEETDTVPLGYSTTIESVFTINIDAVDGLLVDQAVFIEDKETKAIHNLKDGAYSFMTKIGTFNDRFVLRYANRTLSTNKFQKEKESVLVFRKNKQLQINSTEELIDEVAIYDLSGRKMYQRSNINDINFSVLNLVSNHQVVLVNIVFQNGRSVVKKVVY